MDRIKKIQSVRKTLAENGYSVGSWMQIPSASIAEMLSQAGYDWVAVDLEHGTIGHHQLPDLFRALELGDTLPLVRLAQGDARDCKQALDAGAGGVIVPMVESANQLIAIREACRWPPSGTRGVGFSRANLFGRYFEPYREEAQAPILVAMIEHVRAVDNLEEILKVEGLDAILIGPYDLSASMGLTGMFDDKAFKAVMNQIHVICLSKGVACGVHVVAPDPHALNQRIREGYRFLAYSIDAVFFNASCGMPSIEKQ